MNDVVDFKRPKPPAQPPKIPTLKDNFGDDDWILKMCAEWRAARAQMQKNWAEHDLANGWGTLPDARIKLDSEPLERMHELEWHLSSAKPQTMLLARELLGMCVTILAYEGEDPEGTLAQGPVLEIIRNVISSLNHQKATMRIRPKRALHD
jgi:hypothetical protein